MKLNENIRRLTTSPLTMRNNIAWVFIWYAFVYHTLGCEAFKLGESDSLNCHARLGVSKPGLTTKYYMYASDGNAADGRLARLKAWRSQKPLGPTVKQENGPWLQVDFGRESLVTGVMTQGDPTTDYWVTYFQVSYSDNCEEFRELVDNQGKIAVFHANFDRHNVVTNLFHHLIVARCIRIIPLARHGNITAMRIELLGCDVRVCREAVVQHLSARLQSKRGVLRVGKEPKNRSSVPTFTTGGYAEFIFDSEKLLFAAVIQVLKNASTPGIPWHFFIGFSRNCHTWDGMLTSPNSRQLIIFRGYSDRNRAVWNPFPYPIRAQCLRLIPNNPNYSGTGLQLLGNFIGCGTGGGITHKCGMRKHLRYKRVVGGRPSEHPASWPWMVSLEVKAFTAKKFQHVCGGTLVHPQWILTAAHCAYVMYSVGTGNFSTNFTEWNSEHFFSRVRVRLGEHSLKRDEGTQFHLNLVGITVHPDYNISHYINDIALLRLEKPVQYTDNVNRICLIRGNRGHIFRPGYKCTVVGWGHTEAGFPSRINEASIPLIDKAYCQRRYAHLQLTPDMLCAAPPGGGRDACIGDSGGPLMCQRGDRWFQVGVVSWNIGCGLPGFPGVYANVSHVRDWIDYAITSGRT